MRAHCAARRCVWLLVLGTAVAWGTKLAAQQDEGFVNREYPLKALFLYNFGGYVEWPAEAFSDPDAPFVIGVLGTAPVNDTLRQIAATKLLGNRKIVVQQFSSAADVKPCQILFITRSVPAQQQQAAIAALKHQPVLIVGESPGFATRGGDVNFYVQENKIRFEVNLTAIKERQLKVSSKLLAMAKIISDGQSGSVER